MENDTHSIKRHLPSAAFTAVFLIAAFICAGAFALSGAYNVGADDPHTGLVHKTLDVVRERSVAHAAGAVEVPADLESPARLATGAGLYAEMCTGCHLGPGIEPSELSQGLNPEAPQLAHAGREESPARQFWTIKHGIKMSGMPAWGKTHSDDLIWSMVAFVRQLPKMSPDQYRAAVASAPADHDEMMEGMKGMEGMMPAHSDGEAAHSDSGATHSHDEAAPHSHAAEPAHAH